MQSRGRHSLGPAPRRAQAAASAASQPIRRAAAWCCTNKTTVTAQLDAPSQNNVRWHPGERPLARRTSAMKLTAQSRVAGKLVPLWRGHPRALAGRRFLLRPHALAGARQPQGAPRTEYQTWRGCRRRGTGAKRGCRS